MPQTISDRNITTNYIHKCPPIIYNAYQINDHDKIENKIIEKINDHNILKDENYIENFKNSNLFDFISYKNFSCKKISRQGSKECEIIFDKFGIFEKNDSFKYHNFDVYFKIKVSEHVRFVFPTYQYLKREDHFIKICKFFDDKGRLINKLITQADNFVSSLDIINYHDNAIKEWNLFFNYKEEMFKVQSEYFKMFLPSFDPAKKYIFRFIFIENIENDLRNLGFRFPLIDFYTK